MIPIFPELREHLEAVYELADPGSEYIITRYRRTNANLRTTFLKIVARAGLTPWPKIFHNLPSTRQTELEETFPSHVVCAWLGNSEAIARKHYLQLTDEHFERAVGTPEQAAAPAVNATESLAESGARLARSVHIPVQQPAATTRDQTQEPLTESGVMRRVASCREPLRYGSVEDRGLEPRGEFSQPINWKRFTKSTK